MKNFILIVSLFFSFLAFAQNDTLLVDTFYREDQFYITATYNMLAKKTSEVKQYNLSRGIEVGFIRDIPLNKQRNFGIGIGGGYSYNLLYTNIIKNGANFEIVSLENGKIVKNFYEYHQLDVIPLEIRWRTSTPYSHKFWRFYTGIKYSYTLSAFHQVEKENANSRSEIDKKNIGNWKVYLALGHNTWNLYAQYGLTPLFKNQLNSQGKILKMSSLNIGLVFYIL